MESEGKMQISDEDSSLSIHERVEDLLARMTPEEKMAQLGALWSDQLIRGDTVDEDRARELL